MGIYDTTGECVICGISSNFSRPVKSIFEVSSEARELLGKKGYDIQFGARPLKRAIQDLLEDPLCELLMEQGEHAMLFKAEVNTENKDKINITYETR